MADPRLTFQIAFENDPGDEPLTWTTVPGSMAVAYQRGQPNEFGRIETGESSVQVGDAASSLDPNNVGEVVNLLPNPSFETNTDGYEAWTPVAGPQETIARSTAEALFGSASLLVTALYPEQAWVRLLTLASSLEVTPGLPYTLSGYAKQGSGARRLMVEIDWYDAADNFLSTTFSEPAPIPGTGWTRFSWTGVAPANAAKVELWFGTPDTDVGAAGDSFYLDGLQFEQADGPSDYADGDVDGYRWDGAAHASVTRRGYWPNVKRMKAMRAFVTVDGVDYPLFLHFIERLPRTSSVASVWTERTLTGVDAFAWFALAGLKGRSYAGELTGTRWANVLNDIGWPASRRDLDVGNSSLDPITFDDNSDAKALEHLLDVVTNENGFGFIDSEGNARFIERHATILDTTVVATFADGRSIETGNYPGALPYTELKPESTDVLNDYSGQRDGGTAQTAADAASIDAYGPRSQSLTFIVDSDAEVKAAIEWRLSQTKEPAERVDAITIKPADNLARWVAVLGLEVGDRVRVVEWPPGFEAPVETEFLIRHLAASVPASIRASEFTFQLTPAGTDSWFILNDATAGQLDTNKLAY